MSVSKAAVRPLTETQVRALRIIEIHPDLWPKGFAKLMWPQQPDSRNRVGAPTVNWQAAGYLGKLRASGLITGGEQVFVRTNKGRWEWTRSPMWLTTKAKDLLA
jgi:hypothetical protein